LGTVSGNRGFKRSYPKKSYYKKTYRKAAVPATRKTYVQKKDVLSVLSPVEINGPDGKTKLTVNVSDVYCSPWTVWLTGEAAKGRYSVGW